MVKYKESADKIPVYAEILSNILRENHSEQIISYIYKFIKKVF